MALYKNSDEIDARKKDILQIECDHNKEIMYDPLNLNPNDDSLEDHMGDTIEENIDCFIEDLEDEEELYGIIDEIPILQCDLSNWTNQDIYKLFPHLSYKGEVKTYNDLPIINECGDIYYVKDEERNYIWLYNGKTGVLDWMDFGLIAVGYIEDPKLKTDGQVLIYDGINTKWVARDIAAISFSGNINDIIQTTGDILILDCGTSLKNI